MSARRVPHMSLTLASMKDDGVMEKFWVQRRGVGADDVRVKVQYCGICHSDLHQIKGDWGPGLFPMVPGHEIVGVVEEVGEEVTKFKVGDRVGVGCFVDSCGSCAACDAGEETYCRGAVPTYNARRPDGTREFGGYSQSIVTREHFVVRVPDGMDMASAAPLLCAGITTYSPLEHFGAKAAGADCRVAVVGFGGLGHMAVKLAVAMGNQVTVLSRSSRKAGKARELGADFVDTTDADAAAAAARSFDLILDTASSSHDVEFYMKMLRMDGKLVVLGIPTKPFQVQAFTVIGSRTHLTGSMVGGMRQTQEMLEFCAEHNISADITLIDAAEVHVALNALKENSAPTSRFVINVEGSLRSSDDWQVRPPPAGYVDAEAADAAGVSESKTGCGCGRDSCTCTTVCTSTCSCCGTGAAAAPAPAASCCSGSASAAPAPAASCCSGSASAAAAPAASCCSGSASAAAAPAASCCSGSASAAAAPDASCCCGPSCCCDSSSPSSSSCHGCSYAQVLTHVAVGVALVGVGVFIGRRFRA